MAPLLVNLLSMCVISEKETSWRELSQDVVHCESGGFVMFPSLHVENIPSLEHDFFTHPNLLPLCVEK